MQSIETEKYIQHKWKNIYSTFFCEFIQAVWNCDARLFLVVCIFHVLPVPSRVLKKSD